jgi:chromosome partitioning protein
MKAKAIESENINDYKNLKEMKIVFGNQKGGSGKSTLCIMLANHLAINEKKSVLVLDLDMQGTIEDKRTKDTYVNDEFPYQVVKMNISEYPSVSARLKMSNTYILMDLPGNLENPDLKYVLQEADYIICPFEYEFGSYVSTLDFRDLCASVAPSKTLNFVPNKVQGTVKYETQAQMHHELEQSGTISRPLPQKVIFQRMTTFQISEEETNLVKDVFNFLNV